MKTRFRLIRIRGQGGAFYQVDTDTGKRTSLQTASEDEAKQIVDVKNQPTQQPQLNLQSAKAYLAGADQAINARTWGEALEALISTKHGANQICWKTFKKQKALQPILPKVIIETRAEELFDVLKKALF